MEENVSVALTPEDEAFKLEVEIKKLRRNKRRFWRMIQCLGQAKKIKIWEKLGHDSWPSWLAQEGLDLQSNTVDRYLRAYKSIKSRVDDEIARPLFTISRSKVLMIANKITPENSADLVEKAKNLSYSDLKVEMSNNTTNDLDNGFEQYVDDETKPVKPEFKWCNKHNSWSLIRGDLTNICNHSRHDPVE